MLLLITRAVCAVARCPNVIIMRRVLLKAFNRLGRHLVHLMHITSLYYNLPKSQIDRLQLIQNCLARTVVKAPKSSLVAPILRSLHWLKINERIEYKLLSLTYRQSSHNQPT